ncbi:hypothetical protein PQR17_39515 [Paraburkholderia sediminicola]
MPATLAADTTLLAFRLWLDAGSGKSRGILRANVTCHFGVVVLLHSVLARHGVEFVLGGNYAVSGSLAIQLGCFMKVLWHPDACLVHARECVLGDGQVLFSLRTVNDNLAA